MKFETETAIETAAFTAPALAEILFEQFAVATTSEFIVAYSGGGDSQVLLFALHTLRKQYPFILRAAHFNHAIHPAARHWEQFCRGTAARLRVDYCSTTQSLITAGGKGVSLEAVARHARYRWLQTIAAPHAIVLTAHHADDQAETFLMHLWQGKAVEQLAGIAPIRPLLYGSRTRLIRPLLAHRRHQLRTFARHHQLRWVEDESNGCARSYRNYLRHEVLPRLERRTPQFVVQCVQTAARCRAISTRQQQSLARRLPDCLDAARRGVFCRTNPLNLAAWPRLDSYQFSALVRFWLHTAGQSSPSSAQLHTLFGQIFHARTAHASLTSAAGVLRHYRAHLYWTVPLPTPPADAIDWDLSPRLLSPTLSVRLQPVATGGLCASDLGRRRVQWVWRRGGERLQLVNRQHHHALKKLYPRHGIPPWQRAQLPLLYVDGEISWVAGIGVTHAFVAPRGGVVPVFSAVTAANEASVPTRIHAMSPLTP